MDVNLSTTIFISILLGYILLGHVLEERKRNGSTLWLHESGPAIVLGGLLGLIVSHTTGGNGAFEISDKTFFYFVLPPIIFAQGYGLKKRNFFKYFHFITLFGILGTVLQFVFMTGCLYFTSQMFGVTIENEKGVGDKLSLHEATVISACLAAADEVAVLSLIKAREFPKLSAILFGEGVVNDAISILLFHSVVNTRRLDNSSTRGEGASFHQRKLGEQASMFVMRHLAGSADDYANDDDDDDDGGGGGIDDRIGNDKQKTTTTTTTTTTTVEYPSNDADHPGHANHTMTIRTSYGTNYDMSVYDMFR